MKRNTEGLNFEEQNKEMGRADNIEIGDVVARDTPLRGRRPSEEDLEDPIITKQRRSDILSDNTLEIGNAIPANSDTLEMGNTDDTLEIDIKDDKLEIGNAIKTGNPEDTLEMDHINDALEIGNAIPEKKNSIVDKVKKFLKQ